MSVTITARPVTGALIMAIWRRGNPHTLLHHSDQDNQYRNEQFKRLMVDNGVTCPMNLSGNVWDNTAMGSVFCPAQDPADRGEGLPHDGTGETRRVRLRRQLLQLEPTSLDTG